MMTLKYPEPAIKEHNSSALFALSPQGEPGVLPATHQHLVRLRAKIRQRLNGPVTMTCHPHRVGLSSSVAIYLEGKLKQAVNILITVTGQASWPQEDEYAHPRWYITVPDSADLVYLMLWINGLDARQRDLPSPGA
ncbi:acetyltransferase [Klebsiella pneumoniae]|uniref:acetyltransferase n=1 Tax=Serratia marcescens TaxID=615 RepID=UPI0013DA92F0|nr:acetyltransferase [Serratia marcescens]EDD5229999.1 acetyltransferase [Salmonella enterica]ELI9610561.1 acetyltransferase [Klebsiella pneumoniae]HBS5837319.1 acetyltransferase [Klebsiella variicola]HED4009055.1 acetyltransferase [Klebsiella variicola subsp. variicola]ELQ4543990.1 acetyltransferase [Klebsiella pneumoniae]